MVGSSLTPLPHRQAITVLSGRTAAACCSRGCTGGNQVALFTQNRGKHKPKPRHSLNHPLAQAHLSDLPFVPPPIQAAADAVRHGGDGRGAGGIVHQLQLAEPPFRPVRGDLEGRGSGWVPSGRAATCAGAGHRGSGEQRPGHGGGGGYGLKPSSTAAPGGCFAFPTPL